MTNEIKLNLSAADVQELKRAMDMGLGLQIGLPLGANMTVSAATPLEAFFTGREGGFFNISPDSCFTDTAGTTPAVKDDLVESFRDNKGNLYVSTNLPATLEELDGIYWLYRAAGARYQLAVTSAETEFSFGYAGLKQGGGGSRTALSMPFSSGVQRLRPMFDSVNSPEYKGVRASTVSSITPHVANVRDQSTGADITANDGSAGESQLITATASALSGSVTFMGIQDSTGEAMIGRIYGGYWRSGSQTDEDRDFIMGELAATCGLTLA